MSDDLDRIRSSAPLGARDTTLDTMATRLREATAVDVANKERDRRLAELEGIIHGDAHRQGLLPTVVLINERMADTKQTVNQILIVALAIFGALLVMAIAIITKTVREAMMAAGPQWSVVACAYVVLLIGLLVSGRWAVRTLADALRKASAK